MLVFEIYIKLLMHSYCSYFFFLRFGLAPITVDLVNVWFDSTDLSHHKVFLAGHREYLHVLKILQYLVGSLCYWWCSSDHRILETLDIGPSKFQVVWAWPIEHTHVLWFREYKKFRVIVYWVDCLLILIALAFRRVL